MKIVDPEVVVHWLCPKAGGQPVQMQLVQQRDDVAGRQLRYRCPRCEAEATVEFPPAPALNEQERLELIRTLRSGYCQHPCRVNICVDCLAKLERIVADR